MAHAVVDFVDLLTALTDEGFDYAVIGGCAVGAYARLLGEVVLSEDLDLYVSQQTLDELLPWAARRGAATRRRPQPRTVPVAFFTWEGKEVNAILSSIGLPDPDVVASTARRFEVPTRPGAWIPVADAFDLLRNKLAVNREKDRPHIAILRRFVEEEIEETFAGDGEPRDRQAPARRYLEVLGQSTLPPHVVDVLIPHAVAAADLRFLLSRVDGRERAERVLARAEEAGVVDPDLAAIAEARGFGARGG